MGAEAAPGVEVAGALQAVAEADIDVVLVGDEARVAPLLGAAGRWREHISLHHTPEVISMHDAPAIAVKQKKRSSMRVAFDLARAGEVDAVVSAGNTGAALACGLFVLGRLEGVERPGIVTTFPTRGGRCALLDMGANVDIRPVVLAQFAVLGAVYARLMHGKARPRVGLLSNGTEEHKGTILTREAHKLLLRARREGAEAGGQAPGFEYVGYVEGRDIFDGELDVVVTDGFTGNVMLKSLEGLVEAIFHLLREEVGRRGPLAKLGAWLMRPALRGFKHRTDYAETGGAPLLGVAGVPMICHGGSDARAIKNALHEAGALADLDLAEALTRAMAAHAHIWEEAAASPTNERLPS